MPKLTFPLPHGIAWQYHFLVWLQTFHTATLDHVAKILTWTGMEGFYLVLLPVLFWSVNRKFGLRLTYVFLASMFVNAWLKEALRILRPTGIPGIRSILLWSGPGYAMPSGHAQGSMTFWLLIGLWFKKVWLWVGLLVLVLAIGVSRLYVGLHWPLDVLVGWGIGLLAAPLGWALGEWWSYRQLAFSIRLVFAVGLPVVLLLIQQDPISALYAALLLGIGSGAVLEEKWLSVDIEKVWWKRISTAIIGIAGLIAVQWLVTVISVWPIPTELLAIIRGVLTGLWGTLGAPYVFRQSGLYRRKESA